MAPTSDILLPGMPIPGVVAPLPASGSIHASVSPRAKEVELELTPFPSLPSPFLCPLSPHCLFNHTVKAPTLTALIFSHRPSDAFKRTGQSVQLELSFASLVDLVLSLGRQSVTVTSNASSSPVPEPNSVVRPESSFDIDISRGGGRSSS